jgi:hypothetical protein
LDYGRWLIGLADNDANEARRCPTLEPDTLAMETNSSLARQSLELQAENTRKLCQPVT